jgi:arginyl-tRNA synthetase
MKKIITESLNEADFERLQNLLSRLDIAFETEESERWVVDDAFIAELEEDCKGEEFTYEEFIDEMKKWKTNLYNQNYSNTSEKI